MAKSATQNTEITRDDLLRLSRDLNTLVVSLDRIGSYHAEDRAALERALTEFIIEWRVFERLARARRIVDEALLGPNPTPDEEEALAHGDYWEPAG
jgi:hypothetical protein